VDSVVAARGRIFADFAGRSSSREFRQPSARDEEFAVGSDLRWTEVGNGGKTEAGPKVCCTGGAPPVRQAATSAPHRCRSDCSFTTPAQEPNDFTARCCTYTRNSGTEDCTSCSEGHTVEVTLCMCRKLWMTSPVRFLCHTRARWGAKPHHFG
jgi:hypothetical protein